jgi:hypothetical protein
LYRSDHLTEGSFSMTTRIRLAPAGTRQVRRGLERRLRRSLGVDVLEPRRMLAAIDPALLYTSHQRRSPIRTATPSTSRYKAV